MFVISSFHVCPHKTIRARFSFLFLAANALHVHVLNFPFDYHGGFIAFLQVVSPAPRKKGPISKKRRIEREEAREAEEVLHDETFFEVSVGLFLCIVGPLGLEYMYLISHIVSSRLDLPISYYFQRHVWIVPRIRAC